MTQHTLPDSADPPGTAPDDNSASVVAVDLGARRYDICIGAGLLQTLGARVYALRPEARVMVVSDETVAALYEGVVIKSLRRAGIAGESMRLPAGEASKSMAVLETLCRALLQARLERTDLVVALGGGVIGDLVGFAAAITRRGMDFVQVPTSLLAQVDSSVGGKTGINTPQGKNLIGAFHQPILVVADTQVLDTLTAREFRAGYAELVKYGLINDAAFFSWLLSHHGQVFACAGAERAHAIETACRAKAAIVARDEKEHGERALLNLGHTFGHALEALTGYSDALLHGEAVAIGMCMAHRFSNWLDLASAGDAEQVEAHLRAVGLPTRIAHMARDARARITLEAMLAAIAQDKKVRRQRLRFVLTRGVGRAFISGDVAPDQVANFLNREGVR